MQVHAKAQANDGCLQEERRELLDVKVIRVRERHAVDQPGQQRQRGRNEATGCDDKTAEEDVLCVCQASVSLQRYLPVQAVILIAHARRLSFGDAVASSRTVSRL